MARNFLRTDILQLLGSGKGTKVTVVVTEPARSVNWLEKSGARWQPYFPPLALKGRWGGRASLARRAQGGALSRATWPACSCTWA